MGRLVYTLQEAPPDRLVGGARLHYIFHRVFAQAILDFDALSGLSDLDVRVAMRNATGSKPQLFVPEVAFETLVKRQIQKLEDPSLQCVQLIYEELKQIAAQCELPEMQRFPGLREKLLEVASNVVRQCLKPTRTLVSNLIQIELAHINVDHPDFIGGLEAMSKVHPASLQPSLQEAPGGNLGGQMSARGQELPVERRRSNSPSPGLRKPSWNKDGSWSDALRLPAMPEVVAPTGAPSEKERLETDLLKSLVSSYFAIVKRKIMDAVPKTIMHTMVNTIRDSLHHQCITQLYQTDESTSILSEAEEARHRRSHCEQRLLELQRAQDVLFRISDSRGGC